MSNLADNRDYIEPEVLSMQAALIKRGIGEDRVILGGLQKLAFHIILMKQRARLCYLVPCQFCSLKCSEDRRAFNTNISIDEASK